MRYAEGTDVPVERSKAEIEDMLQRYGADQFVSGWKDQEARVQFRANGRSVRLVMMMPNYSDERFTQHPRYAWKVRTKPAQARVYQQEVRRRWRALALVVKAKLEAVTTGITSFEEEFLAHIVMPDGKTVGEHALPLVASAYQSGKVQPLLTGW